MSKLTSAILILSLSCSAVASVHGNSILRGVVKSFDKENIVLEVEGKKIKILRTAVDKSKKQADGMILDFEMTEEEFKALNPE